MQTYAIFLELLLRETKKIKDNCSSPSLCSLQKALRFWQYKLFLRKAWESAKQDSVPQNQIPIFMSSDSRLDLSQFSHSHHSLDTGPKYYSNVHFSIHALLENHSNRDFISLYNHTCILGFWNLQNILLVHKEKMGESKHSRSDQITFQNTSLINFTKYLFLTLVVCFPWKALQAFSCLRGEFRLDY